MQSNLLLVCSARRRFKMETIGTRQPASGGGANTFRLAVSSVSALSDVECGIGQPVGGILLSNELLGPPCASAILIVNDPCALLRWCRFSGQDAKLIPT